MNIVMSHDSESDQPWMGISSPNESLRFCVLQDQQIGIEFRGESYSRDAVMTLRAEILLDSTDFLGELRKVDETLAGEARLGSIPPGEFELLIAAGTRGRIKMTATIGRYQHDETGFHYRVTQNFEFDQTYLREFRTAWRDAIQERL
jgi:hypothetical protein